MFVPFLHHPNPSTLSPSLPLNRWHFEFFLAQPKRGISSIPAPTAPPRRRRQHHRHHHRVAYPVRAVDSPERRQNRRATRGRSSPPPFCSPPPFPSRPSAAVVSTLTPMPSSLVWYHSHPSPEPLSPARWSPSRRRPCRRGRTRVRHDSATSAPHVCVSAAWLPRQLPCQHTRAPFTVQWTESTVDFDQAWTGSIDPRSHLSMTQRFFVLKIIWPEIQFLRADVINRIFL